MKTINGIDASEIDSQEGTDHDKIVSFDNTIFDRIIKAGRWDSAGRIIYDLHFGIQWSINYSYDDYKDYVKRLRKHSIRVKKQDFLNGLVIEAMLEFCIEPKTSREMHDFISEQRAMNIIYFLKIVIKPLIIAKRLKYTIPEFPRHKKQKYYADKS